MENIKDMITQRGFYDIRLDENALIGRRNNDILYVKIYKGKFELNVVKEFLSTTFNLSKDEIRLKDLTNVSNVIIVCQSFQNSHVKEFKGISSLIQIIRRDFFNINITALTPKHEKVPHSDIMGLYHIAAIKIDDPNCIFYNFIVGDLIKITRSDGEIYFRIVKV
jgi:hypothetical protein